MFSGLTLMKDMDIARLSWRTMFYDFRRPCNCTMTWRWGDEQSSDNRGHQRRNVGDA